VIRRIYCDHAATTPVDPQVFERMLPWLNEEFGNPSSLYAEGRRAKDALDQARETVSQAMGCLFAEITFTSSATEAINLAILGLAQKYAGGSRNRILMSAAEHPAALECTEPLRSLGFNVELIPVSDCARVQQDALATMLGEDVLLVAVMQANNETGVINDIASVIESAKRVGALVLVDAVQGFMTQAQSPFELGADMVAISGHKLYGPKGVGALAVRGGIELQPRIVGGAQEREMRAGTENVADIVGLGTAIEIFASRESNAESARNAFWAELVTHLNDHVLRTVPDDVPCLPGHCHFRIPGLSIEPALINLDQAGVCASSGSACSAGSIEPSHVMLACGMTPEHANECLRFTFGRHSTNADGREAAQRLAEIVLRQLALRA
jgi:cysteine desulfurase